MTKEKNKDLAYWKANAEEDYMQVPISVLRYITELEAVVKNCSIPNVVGQSKQLCDCDIPLIRTSDKGGEYCGLCQEDLD